jgi:hypothetical protein
MVPPYLISVRMAKITADTGVLITAHSGVFPVHLIPPVIMTADAIKFIIIRSLMTVRAAEALMIPLINREPVFKRRL